MRATNIRIAKIKPTREQLEHVADMLRGAFYLAGYRADVEIKGAALNISDSGASLHIDTDRLGHNARFRRYGNPVRGYVRTNVPTWHQRVDFNNLINGVLDSLDVSATIRSGAYTVRDSDGAYTSWNSGEYDYLADIVPLTPDMIAEGDERMRSHKKAQRIRTKVQRNATELFGDVAVCTLTYSASHVALETEEAP